jgi:Calponin homology (CH) domain
MLDIDVPDAQNALPNLPALRKVKMLPELEFDDVHVDAPQMPEFVMDEVEDLRKVRRSPTKAHQGSASRVDASQHDDTDSAVDDEKDQGPGGSVQDVLGLGKVGEMSHTDVDDMSAASASATPGAHTEDEHDDGDDDNSDDSAADKLPLEHEDDEHVEDDQSGIHHGVESDLAQVQQEQVSDQEQDSPLVDEAEAEVEVEVEVEQQPAQQAQSEPQVEEQDAESQVVDEPESAESAGTAEAISESLDMEPHMDVPEYELHDAELKAKLEADELDDNNLHANAMLNDEDGAGGRDNDDDDDDHYNHDAVSNQSAQLDVFDSAQQEQEEEKEEAEAPAPAFKPVSTLPVDSDDEFDLDDEELAKLEAETFGDEYDADEAADRDDALSYFKSNKFQAGTDSELSEDEDDGIDHRSSYALHDLENLASNLDEEDEEKERSARRTKARLSARSQHADLSGTLQKIDAEEMRGWVRRRCLGLIDRSVTNLEDDLRSGIVLCAIIHSWNNRFCGNQLHSTGTATASKAIENLEAAFETAEEELDVEALLEPEAFYQGKYPQELVLQYLQFLREAIEERE